MSSTDPATPVEAPIWSAVWWGLAALAIGTGLVCAWRRDGVLNLSGAALLMTFVAAFFTISIARAVEYPFRWRLVAWPAAACLALVSAAGLVHEIGVSVLVVFVFLGLTSPWCISLTARHLLPLTRQRDGDEGMAAATPRTNLTQAEIDRRFDDIVSRL